MRASSWTKSELVQAFAACGTLRDVITQLEAESTAQGEVVCEIRVNGMILNEADEAAFAENELAAIESLEIQTRRPLDLVKDALQSAAELLPQLEQSALVTAELLRAGDVPRSAKGFEETVGGCQWLVETLLHVRQATTGMGQPLTGLTQWMESEKLIGRVVGEVSQAYERADKILVADLLEYEMTAALESWKKTIASELT